MPVAVVPLTSIVTILTFGEALRIKVYFNDGRITEIKSESLSEYVTEKGNPKNIKNVKEVVITYPSPYLKDGVRLIDTPDDLKESIEFSKTVLKDTMGIDIRIFPVLL